MAIFKTANPWKKMLTSKADWNWMCTKTWNWATQTHCYKQRSTFPRVTRTPALFHALRQIKSRYSLLSLNLQPKRTDRKSFSTWTHTTHRVTSGSLYRQVFGGAQKVCAATWAGDFNKNEWWWHYLWIVSAAQILL